MNLKTTIVLALLVGAGAGGWYWLDFRSQRETAVSPTLDYLNSKLVKDKITKVEVTRSVAGKPKTVFILEKNGDDWSLPGNWPVRPQETEQWLAVLGKLRSRFTPIPLAKDADLKPYGLNGDSLTVKVTAGDETRTLRFGQEPDEQNRFTRSTFVRLGDEKEIIQLGPGVFAALDRKPEYFQSRRLFPIERVAKEGGANEKVEEVAASAIEVESKGVRFTLVKKDKDWILQDAYKKDDKNWKPLCSKDRIDAGRRDAMLRGFPDLWAERFVDNKSLEECGLKEPEFIVSVVKANGQPIQLLIGKVSATKDRIEKGKGPPGTPPRFIKEEYRYAKLGGKNNQLFEIKADKLADIAVSLTDLREPRLARFNADDVKRLELRHGDQELVLVNDKEKWRFEKPTKEDAETKTVAELLGQLAGLQVRDNGILDELDPKTVGLDKPNGRIKVTLEEADKEAKKEPGEKEVKKTTRVIVFDLGLKGKDADKLYVRVDDWPRINQVGGELWKLVTRPDLAYRPRDLWRLDRDAITRITIQADAGTPYQLNRADNGWKIGGPLDADIGGKEIETLAQELGNPKCERFETNQTKDLARFGLDKPAFIISVAAKDGKPHRLEIGKITDGGRYARLAGADAVFVLSEKLTNQFRKDPFDLIDKNLLTLNPAAIQRIRFQGATSFTLEDKNNRWQVLDSPTAPFTADDNAIKAALGSWRLLRAEKIVAVGGKLDWAKYGLDKPAATVTVTIKDADKTSDHVIELGKEAVGGGRYGRVDKKDIVAVFDNYAIEDLQPTYLEFLDPRVLKYDAEAVMTIERKAKDADFEIIRREDSWVMTKPGTRDADILTISDVLRKTAQLRVQRIAAFPAKDLAGFGLDKPAAVWTLLLETDGNPGKHVIKVGNLTKDKAKRDTDERYALIDNGPMVVVLPADLSRHLVAPVLHYADRNLAEFSRVDRAELTRGNRKAIFSQTDTGWKMVQPIEAPADNALLDDLVRNMQRLRADVIVADKGADLKKYGLDKPFLQWRFKLGDKEELHLLVGAPENDLPGARRYAKLGDKQQVFLLSSKVAAKVQSEFCDRKVWEPFAPPSKIAVVNKDKNFALIAEGLSWKVVGEPAKKVDAKAVGEAIAALASLRADHYIADAKADMKMYGLADPAWKIKLDSATGPREIWLGGFEEKSKRIYATLPGSSAVFVIDEAIASRLMRSLDAYLETEKKK